MQSPTFYILNVVCKLIEISKFKTNMAKKKFYVVWKGRKTGIFESWNDCKEQIHGFAKAQYKSFGSKNAAEEAYSKTYWEFIGKDTSKPEMSEEEKKLYGEPILNSISVDAACSGNPGLMEYQGVETETKKVIFRKGPYKDSTNNIGEFLALVHALAHMKKTKDKRPIYTDSKIAMSWVRDKTTRTELEETENNKDSFNLIKRAIKWLENNEIENVILKWETKVWGEIPADFGRK